MLFEPEPPHVEEQLHERIAIVTGAARGIGRGIATVLSQRGAHVAVVDLDGHAAANVAEELAGGGASAMGIAGDVTSRESMNAVVRAVLDEFGRVDVCVANAGVVGAPGLDARSEWIDEDWDATYQVNVRGLVRTAEAVVPHMKERRAGRIVNIASHAGRTPAPGAGALGTATVPYSVSKSAALQWTWNLALELAPFNVTVNAVCPGTLWTPMWEKIAEARRLADPSLNQLSGRTIFDRSVKARTPLGRPQTPDDIGRAVAFFASDDARVITGQALNVNGGAVMS